MAAALLAAHVLAAVVFIGPVTVAASTFPRYVRAAASSAYPGAALVSAAAMHRITRVYAVLAVAVPVLGIATASSLDVLGQSWVVASMIMTAAAGLLLILAVVPQQRRVLGLAGTPGEAADLVVRLLRRLAMITGVFNII